MLEVRQEWFYNMHVLIVIEFFVHTRSPVCSEILNCHGDLVRLGVRVRISVYPEDLCATWCMIAVKYRAII